MKGSLWITIYFNLRFLILSIWQVFMGKQLSHSWWGHLKYAFLAFGRLFFSFKSVAWLKRVWKHFPNVSSFFTPGNLSSTLRSYKLNLFYNQVVTLLGQHQFVIVEFCGHPFENGKSYTHAFKKNRKLVENVTTWSRTALPSISGSCYRGSLRIISHLSLGEREGFQPALGKDPGTSADMVITSTLTEPSNHMLNPRDMM